MLWSILLLFLLFFALLPGTSCVVLLIFLELLSLPQFVSLSLRVLCEKSEYGKFFTLSLNKNIVVIFNTI